MSDEQSKYCGCLYYTANALARSLTRMAEEEFSRTGLSPSYAFLLMGVNEKPGIQPGTLSQQMQLSPSTITRLIEKMELKGYLQRKSSGRCTEVYPTQKSLDLDAQIKSAWQNLYQRYSETLGEKAAIQLTQETFEATQRLNE